MLAARRTKPNGPELLLGLHSSGTYVLGVSAETIGGEQTQALFEYPVGEDPASKSFMEQGGSFELDDLLGDWEMIEAEAFATCGALVPVGLRVNYERHPEDAGLMISTTTAPQRNPDFSQHELVFLDLRLVRHMHSFALETSGLPDDPLGGPRQQAAPAMLPQAPATQPSTRLSLDGVWQRQDGLLLLIQGNEFQVSQYGIPIDAGVLALEQNILMSISAYTGVQEQFVFSLEGDALRLQDPWGGVYLYRRIQ